MNEQILRKSFPADVSAGEEGIVEAIVSVFGNADRQREVVKAGCFTKSLAAKKPKGVWAHDWTKPIAKTLEARELMPGDAMLPAGLKMNGGLYIKGQFNLNTQRGREAYEDLKFGTMDEFSIGFRVLADSFDAKTGTRILEQCELYEWSPVLVGANPATTMLSLKDAEGGSGMTGTETKEPAITESELAAESKGYYEVAVAESEMSDNLWRYVHALSRALHELREDCAEGKCSDPEMMLRETLLAFVNDLYGWLLPLLQQQKSADDDLALAADAPALKAFADLHALSLTGSNFQSHSETVLAAVQEYARRAGEIASLRAKEGRQISAANRERLLTTCQSIQTAMQGMGDCHKRLMEMVETDQKPEAKDAVEPTVNGLSEQLELLRLRRRSAPAVAV